MPRQNLTETAWCPDTLQKDFLQIFTQANETSIPIQNLRVIFQNISLRKINVPRQNLREISLKQKKIYIRNP